MANIIAVDTREQTLEGAYPLSTADLTPAPSSFVETPAAGSYRQGDVRDVSLSVVLQAALIEPGWLTSWCGQPVSR